MAQSRAFSATKYSVLALRPAATIRPSGVTVWERWERWAERNGILGKNGKPSLSKVKLLIKHHCLACTKAGGRIMVASRFPEQLEWEPERWQGEYQALFSRSQGNKARGRRK